MTALATPKTATERHILGSRWSILALLVAARATLGVQFQTMATVGDDVALAFGVDHAGIGALIGLFMLPGLVLALPAGLAGRWLSDRWLAGGGLALLAAGGALSGMAEGTGGIGAGRMVAGAGFLVTTLFFTKMVVDWFEGREIATALSALVMAWPFGIALGQVGHEWLSQSWGWRVPFLTSALMCAVAAIAVLALYRSPGRTGAPAPRRFRLGGTEWRRILLAGAAWGAFNAGYIVYLGFGPQFLVAEGQSAFGAATTVSVTSWIMIGSGLVFGRIADRFGRHGLLLTGAVLVAAAATLLFTAPGGALAGGILLGLIGMAPAGLVMAMAGAALPAEARAFGMGVFFSVYHAATAAAPPIAGYLLDATSAPAAPMALAAALFLAVVPIRMMFVRGVAQGPAIR